MTEFNIENLTIEQLKALAYDTILKIEVEQRNLAILNQHIEQKKVEVKQPEK